LEEDGVKMFYMRLLVCFTIGLTLVLPGTVLADIYRYKDKDGVWHFTNIKSDIRYKLYIKSFVGKPSAYIKEFGSIIDQAAERFLVDPSLIKAVIKAESDFDKKAISKKGAQGLMQLMPTTADAMEVADPFNPEENIFGGTRYLSRLLERFRDDKRLALAAYNAGPEKVASYNGVPPFPETRAFVKKVLSYYKEYQSASE